ncbi:type II toxin-antitoxin system VapC family toxin [Bosea sp. 685]|uniref:type II toxin-antitoxin system VapC family toxin n=1 Tax=Bosea sp. 685 TaxID=3080057 RepID=UPI0028936B0A|nr:type II toxin-antitoxin system VapC family toxin [Bosea sp. 685]WNJ92269.1 type II toxin-antitoxin system VapC family toxin [Bosea sp. 685]
MSLVVDTSAIVACLTKEPERPAFMRILALAERRVLSSVNLLEARIVITGSKGLPRDWLEEFIENEQIEIVAFDENLSDLAFDGYRRYGKGRHPAKLNMGDCAAYALAKARGWPLLFKGEDFSLTDVERA